MKPVYKPSHVLRLIAAGKIADPQPKGEGKIMCESKRHRIQGDTESPSFWENGNYVFCGTCNALALARVEFKDFAIDLTGERRQYPLYPEGHAPVEQHDYRVEWVIDISAPSPRAAAEEARRIQRDPDSTATVFFVQKDGQSESIDLSED